MGAGRGIVGVSHACIPMAFVACTQGGLPVLARLVGKGCREMVRVHTLPGSSEGGGEGGQAGDAKHWPSLTCLGQLKLSLDLLESAAFLNVENQKAVGVFVIPGEGEGEGRGKLVRTTGRERQSRGNVSFVAVLLELLGCIRALTESPTAEGRGTGKCGSDQEEKEEGEVVEGLVDDQPASVRRHVSDVLLATLRVIVNLTHHNPETIQILTQVSARRYSYL